MGLNCSVTVAALRSDLAAAAFSVERLTALWGPDAAAALHRGHRVPALRALPSEPTPLSTLATAFVLGLPVGGDDLDAALPALGAAGAAGLGLVRLADGAAEPLLDLRPYSFVDANGVGEWWIVSDLSELATGAPLREDHVLGVGGASSTLSGLTIGSAVRSVLDLGTGCGIQAMHAARHADRVVATDISARALEIARLNAELNGIRNIEFRPGSLFEPVAGERFDRVVSNPPFVITPRAGGVPAYEYRDGGMVGDALVQAVVEGLAEHLEPGGVAQLLGNWEYRPGASGLERAVRWASDRGLDVWAIERELQDPAAYAETWIRDGGMRPGAEFDRLYAAWLADFETRGVTSVGFGYLTVRRPRDRPSLRRLERLDGPVAPGLGERIAATLAAHDALAALDDEALAARHLGVAPDVTVERHYWPGDEDPTAMTLRQGGGFQRAEPVGTALAALVGACDGELSVRAIVAALAELLEADQDALSAELLPSIRSLVLDGFLLLE